LRNIQGKVIGNSQDRESDLVIVIAVKKSDGGLLTRALENIASQKIKKLSIRIVGNESDARWMTPLVEHFRKDEPVDIVYVPDSASRLDMFRASLDGLRTKYVGFMRSRDLWSQYGIWRVLSLGIGTDADILAGATTCEVDRGGISSPLAGMLKDRAYGVDLSRFPSLIFDSQIFGKFFRPETARRLFCQDVDIDRGGFLHRGLQAAYASSSICLNNNVVYRFLGDRQYNIASPLPFHDETFSLDNILSFWGDDRSIIRNYLWPQLISPEFYFALPDNRSGKEWMERFLNEQVSALEVPKELRERLYGDKPRDLFVKSIVEKRYADTYELMKRCRYRTTIVLDEGKQMRKARSRNRLDEAGREALEERILKAALEQPAIQPPQPGVRRKGVPFRNFLIDRAEGFGTHRSGWSSIMHALSKASSLADTPVFVDSFMERTYCWDADISVPRRDVPWVGFAHRPPGIPDWYPADLRRQFYHHPDFILSLDTCLGVFALSEYHARYLRSVLPVPVDVIYHPAESVDLLWNPELLDRRPSVVQVGFWLRKMHGIYFLPPGNYDKILLNKGNKESAASQAFEREAQQLRREGHDLDALYRTVRELAYLPNDEYDRLLSSAVVFLDMYDASANNTVVECMVRHTPLLVRRMPPVEEYLGEEYPFFFDSYEEAAAKLEDRDLILATHEYLKQPSVSERISMDLFINNFTTSPLFRTLKGW